MRSPSNGSEMESPSDSGEVESPSDWDVVSALSKVEESASLVTGSVSQKAHLCPLSLLLVFPPP